MTYQVIKTGSRALSLRHSLSHQVLNYSPILDFEMAGLRKNDIIIEVGSSFVRVPRQVDSDGCGFYLVTAEVPSDEEVSVYVAQGYRDILESGNLFAHVVFYRANGPTQSRELYNFDVCDYMVYKEKGLQAVRIYLSKEDANQGDAFGETGFVCPKCDDTDM